ncbi:type I secretion system permease/ATPase [Roseinatronobacter sp. NSM]|uniref:type I secretion system permease/ATPase n=1 Tax=Roseinatronobacter sp. NSM TaxID=3457785 RepID=UPI00403519C7
MSITRERLTVRSVIASGSGALFLATLLFSIGINLLALTAPMYMLQVYDRVLASSSFETLIYLSLIAAVALLTFALLEGVRTRLLARIGARFHDTMTETLLRRSIYMSAIPAAQGLPPSDRDVDQVRAFIGGAPVTAFLDFPWIFIFLGVLYVLHPWFFYAALVAAIVLIVLALVSELATRGRVGQAAGAAQMAQMLLSSGRRNAELVEGMGMRAALESRWRDAQNAALSGQLSAQDRESQIGGISKFIRLATQSAMLGLGAWLVIMGQATPGVMIAASILAARALAPIDIAIGSWKTFVGARGAANRLNDFLSGSGDRPESQELPAPKGLVEVENATLFLPNSSDPILRDVTLKVEPGQALAIIGPSAAGKSSLLRLVSGVWRPTRGAVRLDGAMTFNWPRAQFGAHVGVLPQEVALFSGTVAENIARMQEPDAQAVVDAARKAGVHELILRLPMGYETPIGDQGVKLSGGQRQRIGLARALYGNPALLLLDEPNSHLDQSGEEALARCISEVIAEGRSVILIAHRPSVLNAVTHVAVLREGQLVDNGPRDQVLARIRSSEQSVAATPATAQTQQAVSLGSVGAKLPPLVLKGGSMSQPRLRPVVVKTKESERET